MFAAIAAIAAIIFKVRNRNIYTTTNINIYKGLENFLAAMAAMAAKGENPIFTMVKRYFFV